MICPVCQNPLGWIGDFACDEVHGCECENGIVGYYECTSAMCDAKVEITTNCSGDEGE